MKKIVTHDGRFHTDEIFGVAVLQLALASEELTIVRTRAQAEINDADIVLDVGGEYDPSRSRFDHHQNGAPVRENGIPYAAFGLVWKEFGVQVAGSMEIAEKVENRLAQAIDAGDNGVALYAINEYGVAPLELFSFLESFMPPMGSDASEDEAFFKAVDVAREYLLRVIENYRLKEVLKAEAARVYEATEDKSVLVFDTPMKPGVLSEYEDVMVVISPRDEEKTIWSATALSAESAMFERRVSFPEAWAGLREEELAHVSGIEGAIFCHKNLFLFVCNTKEGAIAAAKQAA